MTQLVGQILRSQAKITEINVKRRLFQEGKVATGRTRSQLLYDVTDLPNGGFRLFGVQVTGGYPNWQVIDRGARGPFRAMMPETPEFRDWLRARGIPQSASFPIRKKISRDGIKPTYIFSEENQRTWEDVQAKIPNAWMQTLRNKFQEYKNI